MRSGEHTAAGGAGVGALWPPGSSAEVTRQIVAVKSQPWRKEQTAKDGATRNMRPDGSERVHGSGPMFAQTRRREGGSRVPRRSWATTRPSPRPLRRKASTCS